MISTCSVGQAGFPWLVGAFLTDRGEAVPREDVIDPLWNELLSSSRTCGGITGDPRDYQRERHPLFSSERKLDLPLDNTMMCRL